MVATRAFPGWGHVVLPEKAPGIQRLAGPRLGQGEARIVSTSATTGVAGRYASALFELADNAKALDQVAQDLDTFKKLIAESSELFAPDREPGARPRPAGQGDARRARRRRRQRPDPQLHRHRRRQRPRPRAAGDGHRLSRRAGATAAARRRATVTAGRAADAATDAAAHRRDALRAGGAKVSIDVHVDPGLLGGLVVKVGSRMIDSSLAASCSACSLP